MKLEHRPGENNPFNSTIFEVEAWTEEVDVDEAFNWEQFLDAVEENENGVYVRFVADEVDLHELESVYAPGVVRLGVSNG